MYHFLMRSFYLNIFEFLKVRSFEVIVSTLGNLSNSVTLSELYTLDTLPADSARERAARVFPGL